MALLGLYIQNRASDFDDFCTDAIIIIMVRPWPKPWKILNCARPRGLAWSYQDLVAEYLCLLRLHPGKKVCALLHFVKMASKVEWMR